MPDEFAWFAIPQQFNVQMTDKRIMTGYQRQEAMLAKVHDVMHHGKFPPLRHNTSTA